MYRRVLAFDFDGTLAENGLVPAALQQALEELSLEGYVLFLVTGRTLDSVDLGPLHERFAGIVWENGAVLSVKGTDELYLPFGHIDPHLIHDLELAGVSLERGLAIVATWTPYEEIVWHTLQESGSEVVIVHNKGAVMVLPLPTLCPL